MLANCSCIGHYTHTHQTRVDLSALVYTGTLHHFQETAESEKALLYASWSLYIFPA